MADEVGAEGGAEESIFEESGIPEGFERLTEPQTTKIDVYFGGRFLISTPVVYTPESIEFTTPDEVVKHIPESSRKEVLIEALSGPLDRHDNFLCAGFNCPLYDPDMAGVVFDESNFRLTLHINKNYLPPPQQPDLQFLPPSSADGAFLQTGNLLFSGSHTSGDISSPDSETWTFFGQSTLSLREQSLESHWDQDKERGFGIRSLSLASDHQGFYYNAGLIPGRGFGLTFSPDHTLLGVHMGSSARTLMDDGFNQSTRLPVFRANRGRVDVLRDGRLIHTEFQEAGNQLINTQSFPSGAYEITIKVYDGNILQDEETRFFVKTTFLPPSDIPQYFFELGQRANPQVTGV
ncbi:MAG: TcfC E-set like domain-containing protein, partial [Endozoicomonas sp.]